jgi:outer membrane biosynthesis protein TonB
MIPQSQPRKKKNSARVNLTISFIFHALLVAVLIYFAAREGYLGKKLQKISVQMVKEKPPEKPKEPPKQEPKVEPPKTVQAPPKMVEAPKVQAPPTVAPPVTAPPPAELPAFDFGGGHAVNSESDPVQLYKGYMEYELRNRWNKPDNLADDSYVAEVQIHVDRAGNLSDPVWQQGSGNPKWDDSVKAVFKEVTAIDRPPPTNFPPMVTIRFDVDNEAEPVLQ